MSEIILYIATSVDGFIAGPDGGVDWLSQVEDEQEDYGYARFYDSVDALVMGSQTYQQILGFGDWPYAGKQTYVMTRRDLPNDRTDVTLFSNNTEQAATHFRQHHSRIWLVGGGQLVNSFHQLRQIDEYQLFIIPVTLGNGIPLFPGQSDMQQLELTFSTSYPKGVVELHYTRHDK